MSIASRFRRIFSPNRQQQLNTNRTIANKIAPGFMKGYENIDSYKKGGKVKKTGLAYLHKGERVLTTKQARSRAMDKKKEC